MNKRIKKTLALLLPLSVFSTLMVSCADNKVASKEETKDSLSTISTLPQKEKGESYAEKEMAVLKPYLEEKHYLFPTREEFKKRCLEYWGIDVDTIPSVFYPEGEDQLFTDGMVFRHGSESVYYYPSYESQIEGEPKRDAEEALAAMIYDDDSLDYHYNQLLFHDDKHALSKFILSPDLAYNVVYHHNYEKNKLLLQKAAAQYTWPDERFWKELRYALFYNNLERGIRKDFIKHIAHFESEVPENYTRAQGEPEFCTLIYMYIDVFDYIDVPLDLKDECLCYMVLLLDDFCDEFNAKHSCGEAVGATNCLAYMVKMNGYGFVERIEHKNYFGNLHLKELIKNGMSYRNLPFDNPKREGVIDNDLAMLLGRVVDKDGYVNLREKSDLKSNVIGTVPTGEDVRIVDMKEDEIRAATMLKVRTKDGEVGYIHASRLRLFVMKKDEDRKSALESYHLPSIKSYEW